VRVKGKQKMKQIIGNKKEEREREREREKEHINK
jgi:hypothetical protein